MLFLRSTVVLVIKLENRDFPYAAAEDSLQVDIDSLLQWAVVNRMKFHPDKCKLLRCTHKRSPLDIRYFLGNSEINSHSSETDLGVHTTQKLSFTEHQNKTLSKFSQRLGLVKRVCTLIDSCHKRRTLYVSLVRSLFEHCCQVWRPVSDAGLIKFEKLQKRAVKWVNNEEDVSYDHKTYMSKLKQCNLLPISKKFMFSDLKLFHKIFYGTTPTLLPSFLHKYDRISDYRRYTRLQNNRDSTDIICTEQPRSDTFVHSYFYRCHKEWNKLPTDMRNVVEHDHFCTRLNEFLLETI